MRGVAFMFATQNLESSLLLFPLPSPRLRYLDHCSSKACPVISASSIRVSQLAQVLGTHAPTIAARSSTMEEVDFLLHSQTPVENGVDYKYRFIVYRRRIERE
jgi:hypothetical protein